MTHHNLLPVVIRMFTTFFICLFWLRFLKNQYGNDVPHVCIFLSRPELLFKSSSLQVNT